MAEQGNRTFLKNVVDPEVLADMISAKLDKKIRVTPFARIDTTLQGRPGSTITVPKWNYTGEATVVPEGEEIPIHKLTSSTAEYTIHKIGDGKTITDEAILSGYGDPYGECVKQIVMAVADYIDDESMAELGDASNIFEATSKISYNNIVDAIDLLQEEVNSPKVMFVHPSQVSTLRKDSNFISADKYGAGTNVIMYGEIGMIANTRIVPSKRVVKNAEGYKKVNSGDSGALEVVASGASGGTQIDLASITKTYPSSYTPAVGDYVAKIDANTYFINPIVKLNGDEETEEDTPALTIFLKRDTNVEVERQSTKRQTVVTADKHYVVALTNESRVALMFAKA